MKKLASFVFLLAWEIAVAQPQPGDVFRDYHWLPNMVKESGKFLRVGGRLDYSINPNHFPADAHQDGFIPLKQALDLEGAVKAEIVIEKILSHEGTRGLSIQVNNSEWLPVPEADSIPNPAYDYMHHFNPVVAVPLDLLNEGEDNTFRVKVDTTHYWNWPQNLLYGVTFRIYYDKASPFATDDSPLQINTTENGFHLSLDAENVEGIQQVDYIGYYEDADREG
ncbi:MAG: hypothetical protein ACFB15_06565 [Cyclobacteriaceae bacterium]